MGGIADDLMAAAAVVTAPAFAPEVGELAPALALPGSGNSLADFAFKLGSQMAAKGIYFRRAGIFQRVGEDGSLEPVGSQQFRTEPDAAKAARFIEDHVSENMTNDTAAAVLNSRLFLQCFPEISRVSEVRLPVIRADGRLELLPPGYDPETKILVLPKVEIPEEMPEAEAREFLQNLIRDFPWPQDAAEAERGRARMLAAMLAGLVSGMIPRSLHPAFFFHANSEGSGKTLAARLCVCPVFGRANIDGFEDGKSAELRKKLDATAISGASYLFLDNLKGRVDSGALEAFITASRWGGRILAVSKNFEVDLDCLVYLTGNHATLSPDLNRRCVHVKFFMQEADPMGRPCPAQIMDEAWILENRGRILGALYAVIRKWDAAGRPPGSTLPTLEAWTSRVGGMVQTWTGVDVFAPAPETADPVLVDFVAWMTGLDVPAGQSLQIEQKAVRESWIDCGLFKDLFPEEETDGNAASYEQRARKIFKRFDGRTAGRRRFAIIPNSRPRKVLITSLVDASCSEIEHDM